MIFFSNLINWKASPRPAQYCFHVFFLKFLLDYTSSNWWSGGRQVQVILIFLRLEAVLVHWLAGRCCLYSSWSVGSVETTELLPDRGRGQDTHHNSRTVCTEYWVLWPGNLTTQQAPHRTSHQLLKYQNKLKLIEVVFMENIIIFLLAGCSLCLLALLG